MSAGPVTRSGSRDDVVRVESLTVGYGRVDVLREVSATVRRGEVYGVLGPNGCGKTTLVRALAALLDPRSGRIEIDGRPVESYERRELARVLAMAPQDVSWDFPFTVLESVLLGRAPHLPPLGLEGPEDLAICAEALARTDLTDLQHRPVHELSGGERRRALVARTLAQQAPIVILDEPVAALDIAHQVGILGLLRREAASGTTVVIVLHDLNLAAAHCDRILLLKGGRVVAEGTVPEVLTYSRIREVYGVDVYVGENELTGHRILVPFSGPGASAAGSPGSGDPGGDAPG